MSLPRFPLIPTIVVLAAVATMVALGVWQLGRADEKAALIARYVEASRDAESAEFPVAGNGEAVWFRRSSVECVNVLVIEPTAGRSRTGQSGWAQRARCTTGGSDVAVTVDLGWTRAPEPVAWSGGTVEGIVAPGPRLVANTPVLDALEPLAPPDPNDLPNNHLAYAMQWFFFAATALVIYVLALRRRQANRPSFSEEGQRDFPNASEG